MLAWSLIVYAGVAGILRVVLRQVSGDVRCSAAHRQCP
jgi:hypothetical protein